MSRFRHTPPFAPARSNALGALFNTTPTYPTSPFTPAPRNALMDVRPKTEYVPGYYRQVPFGLGGGTVWVPGYWRREG